MQSRKRAKSITFGNKEKKEVKHEEPKETLSAELPKNEPEVDSVVKVSEKAAVVERRTIPEKTVPDDVSVTPDEVENESTAESIATLANEFVTDASATSSEELTKLSESEPVTLGNEPSDVTQVAPQLTSELSQPTVPVQNQQELSPTPPASAFSIQGGDVESNEGNGSGKRRFGIYFFVVAFLAFILGLGVMAAITYGGINLNMLGSLGNLKMPGMMTPKPIVTTAQPTSKPLPSPTAKPVDLSAYKITVLNGSGVAGKAGDVKSTLDTAGFKVTATGNADKNDYTKTLIIVKKKVDQGYLIKLQDELKKSFTLDTVSTIPDSATTEPDVKVILGTQTAK